MKKIIFFLMLILWIFSYAVDLEFALPDSTQTSEPKIVKMEEMIIIGLQEKMSMTDMTIPKLWKDFTPREDEIQNLVNPEQFWGVSFDMEQKEGTTEFSYMVGRQVKNTKNVPEGMSFHIVEARIYAVFSYKGPVENLEKTYKYIYQEWLPKSGHKPVMNDELELYDDRFKYDEPDSEMFIYVPIK